MADGLSLGSEADHASLRFIQSNLQRSKLATAELLGHPTGGPACRTRKAAILILDSDVDVEEDQTLIDENVTAGVVTAGNCRIGVVSVYFECDKPIGPYLDRVKWVCSKLGTNKIILGGDVNAWSVWWGSERDDARGTELCDFLDVEGLHVLNEGNIPTFELYRGDRLLRSMVDVTACSSALLDRAEEWQVVRGVTSSDHNAVMFNVRTGGRSGPEPFRGTRIYNTAKARWSEFLTAFDNAKEERALTAGTVEAVDSCDRLDEVVDLYTECVQHACDSAIPRKRSMRRPKLPWWSPELEGLKRDANTKKRRIRNAAPSRRRYVVEEYVRAKEVYERAAADAQTTSWKRFCTAQDRESIWDGIYRVIRNTGRNREDVLLINDSGQTCSPNESAVLLANTT
ncbi:Retrovirus-related Pol polyprotein from type-1 retrotransposable element R1 [Eumeta japonica]|uniref:Retrovirus-related Pol polyprotein from type-1 retrotransposable element R1 n=1 Tax=Eumeta variegata TaxID=151549 RepID=A0A4C1WGJ7_EUMVA|nr:Retrovirus-related Pol polyprotein from type-1 retrotransposable element R1 [Eumeta japonica]